MAATDASVTRPPVGLLRAATERYKLDPIRDVRRLDGGHENELYRLESGDRTFVLRVEVAAAHPDSLRWEHSLAQFLAGSIPEVVGPLRAPDGSTFFVHEGRAATLLPYVDATPADRDRDWRAAAELLGALHAVSVTRSFPSRPGYPSLAERVWSAPSVAQVPASIRARRNQIERELARCHAWITGRRLRTGATHGDFYGGNVLVAAGRVAGLVDWTEAHVDSFAYELANGVWEFCKDEDDFDRDRAGEFVSLYSEAGGVATAEEQAEALLAVPIPGWRASPAIRGKRPVDAPSVNSERTVELLVPLIRCRLVLEVAREIRLNGPDAEWNYALHLLRSLESLG